MAQNQNTSKRTSNAQGTTYEARMCIFLFVRAYMRNLKRFTLEYQAQDADKFDDIVFNDGNGKYQMFQLKHKQSDHFGQQIQLNQKKKITLFTEESNTDFNLIKYVKAVTIANSTPRFKDNIGAAVVVTNTIFELNNNDELNLMMNQTAKAKMWYDGLKSIKLTPITPDSSAIFDMSSVWSNAKYYKFTDDPNIVQILKRQAPTLVKNVTEDKIRESLDKIIYGVQQPNVLQLTEIIKNELKNYYKLNNADTIYEKLETLFRDWCDTKNPLGFCSTSNQSNVSKQHVLTFVDADKFFQKNVKKVSFGVTAPTNAFIGRTEELEKIKERLYEQSSLIVSQSVKISGLGGIGKTQLTKQFIKKFGQSEFFGRIMWIEAETDDTIKNSFEKLAQKLNILDARNKDAEVLIHDIFQYFDGLKALFVFDNFEKSSVNKGLVTHCLKIANDPTKKCRPFFIFTSRNRECLPGIPCLDLNVLSPEDATQLIVNELKEVNFTKDDAKKLAETLQYFPLALRQGIAYIKQQQRKQQVLGKRYDIQDYFRKFEKETQALLDFEFPDDFGENEKTTFITWNVTLEMIELDKNHGNDTIQVLRIFSYLYADKIDSEMFLPMFNNNEDKLAEAFLLLEKYSMITKIEQETTFYQIHRLVQAVIRLKFKNQDKEDFLEKTFKLIHPELYYFAADNDNIDRIYRNFNMCKLMKQLSLDRILHYKSLSAHMLKYQNLKTKYESFFEKLSDIAISGALRTDDVDKIKSLKVPTEGLKRIIEEEIEGIIYFDCNKVMKYLIENGVIGVNDQMQGKSLIRMSLGKNNFELFKYLIEKGAEVLNFSLNLISEIRNGKTDLLYPIIRYCYKSEEKEIILNQCLFFATLFNQESIARILLKNIVVIMNFHIIFVAATSGQVNLVKIMLEKCSKEVLFKCLLILSYKRYFNDKEMFEIIFNNYLEKGGDVNEQDNDGESLLNLVTNPVFLNIAKLAIINFLLDKGADPYLSNNYGYNALFSLFCVQYNDLQSSDDKLRIDELLNQKILNDLTPEKFINFLVKGLFKFYDGSTDEYYQDMFDKLLREIGDINVRNESGETLLINYLKNMRPNIEIVKFLVENNEYRFDIIARDNKGKSALDYAAKLEYNEIYQYLRNIHT